MASSPADSRPTRPAASSHRRSDTWRFMTGFICGRRWWNPFEGTGTPLAGEMQSAALSPFTIFTAVSNGQLYEHMLFELISGISTYLLLRRLGIARWASTAAAIVFALNGTFAWFTHAPVNVVPFLPLLLLGIESAYAASVAGRRGGWWLIAVAGALSVYAGFPETAYINAMFAGLWVLWRRAAPGAERPRVPDQGRAGHRLRGAARGSAARRLRRLPPRRRQRPRRDREQPPAWSGAADAAASVYLRTDLRVQ